MTTITPDEITAVETYLRSRAVTGCEHAARVGVHAGKPTPPMLCGLHLAAGLLCYACLEEHWLTNHDPAGHICRTCGTVIPVDALVEAPIAVLSGERPLVTFPDGTRHRLERGTNVGYFAPPFCLPCADKRHAAPLN